MRTDDFVVLLDIMEDLRSQTFCQRVQFVLLFPAGFVGQGPGVVTQQLGARVGNRVDRMADAIDQSALVKGFLAQDSGQVIADLHFVAPVLDRGGQILQHIIGFAAGTAVLRTLERTDGRCDRGIRVGSRRRDRVGDKGRVVTAAMLGMQNEG